MKWLATLLIVTQLCSQAVSIAKNQEQPAAPAGSRGNTIAGSYPGTDAGANASRYANANRNAGRYAGNEKGDAKARIQYAAGVCTAYDAQRHFLY